MPRMEIDLSRLPAAVRQKMDDIFRGDHDLRVLQAIQRQTQTANARRDTVRWHELLRPQYEIDPMVDLLWRQFYGHNYTENPDLMRFLAKRNPEIAVHARSPKTQVGYCAPRPAPRAPRPARGGVRFDRNTLVLAK